jgi:hypothetical protein
VPGRALIAIGCVAAALAAAPSASAFPNPADDPVLLNTPIEEDGYDHAHKCLRKVQPGARHLQGWIDRHFRGEPWGVVRCEKLSKTTRSLHSEGRALDWHLDARNGAERRAANSLIEMLLATDQLGNAHALARRMGVQEIIFNCQSWFSGSDTLGRYDACNRKRVDRTTAHKDHVHIGLNWQGAKALTSFWKSGLAGR